MVFYTFLVDIEYYTYGEIVWWKLPYWVPTRYQFGRIEYDGSM